MQFVSKFIYCVANWSQLGTACEENSTLIRFTPPISHYISKLILKNVHFRQVVEGCDFYDLKL